MGKSLSKSAQSIKEKSKQQFDEQNLIKICISQSEKNANQNENLKQQDKISYVDEKLSISISNIPEVCTSDEIALQNDASTNQTQDKESTENCANKVEPNKEEKCTASYSDLQQVKACQITDLSNDTDRTAAFPANAITKGSNFINAAGDTGIMLENNMRKINRIDIPNTRLSTIEEEVDNAHKMKIGNGVSTETQGLKTAHHKLLECDTEKNKCMFSTVKSNPHVAISFSQPCNIEEQKIIQFFKNLYPTNDIVQDESKVSETKQINCPALIKPTHAGMTHITHRIWVTINDHDIDAFYNSHDRRIESIRRLCKCRITLLPGARRRLGLMKQELVIEAASIETITKCCKMLDDKFPHFYTCSTLANLHTANQEICSDIYYQPNEVLFVK